MAERKLGRKPRAFDPTMPHMSAVRMMAHQKLPPIPLATHWADPLPDDLGMMLNDQLGDCTCAAAYHAMQVWSHHGRSTLLTEPSQYVLQMYQEFAGYDGTEATDQGAVEQDILRQWLSRGVPIQEGTETRPGPGRSYILSAMEVDPHNRESVKRAIYDCGGVYIGFDVPAWLMQTPKPPSVWDARSKQDNQIVGGHAVFCSGYNSKTVDVLSWGQKYRMTWQFFEKSVREAYALVRPWWIDATGHTPFGLSLDVLVYQMAQFCPLRMGSPSVYPSSWGSG
jgi:hypothetical protein